jgi:hypothetical protein
MPEPVFIQPLSADEIKDGLITKICEAIYDAMNKTCNLYGCAYPKFRAKFSIDLELDNFGDVRLDRVAGEAESEGEFHNAQTIPIAGEVPFTPPNVFRKQTGQAVPVTVEKDDGTVEQKAVFYKRDRSRSLGRAKPETDV